MLAQRRSNPAPCTAFHAAAAPTHRPTRRGQSDSAAYRRSLLCCTSYVCLLQGKKKSMGKCATQYVARVAAPSAASWRTRPKSIRANSTGAPRGILASPSAAERAAPLDSIPSPMTCRDGRGGTDSAISAGRAAPNYTSARSLRMHAVGFYAYLDGGFFLATAAQLYCSAGSGVHMLLDMAMSATAEAKAALARRKDARHPPQEV